MSAMLSTGRSARNSGVALEPALLFCEVGPVLLVLIAEHFKDVGVRKKIVRNFDGKGLREHLRVVEGHLDIQVSEVAAMEALRDVQGFTMGRADRVEHGFIIEARGFNHKDVALPVP